MSFFRYKAGISITLTSETKSRIVSASFVIFKAITDN